MDSTLNKAIEQYAEIVYKCIYCKRKYTTKANANHHAGQCPKNPANKSCLTCSLFYKAHCDGSDDCACLGLNHCVLELDQANTPSQLQCPDHTIHNLKNGVSNG